MTDTRTSSELIERLRALAEFLAGQAPLGGLWFGEGKKLQTGYMARFWWRRTHLPALTEAADTIEALATQLTRQSEALRQGAAWFAEYADHHEQLAKAAGHHVGKERNAKAERNRERAAFLAQAWETRHD